jgi:hypothetical protein
MTGSAKQSISPRQEKMDCFRLRSSSYGGQVAPYNDGAPIAATTSRPRGAKRPSRSRNVRPNREGAGNAGCPMHPQPRVRSVESTRVNHHRFTGIARRSPRNGFTAYSVLSPATNSSCHRHRRIKVLRNPVGPAKTSANLAPATGARTTRLYRTLQRRSSARLDRSQAKSPPCHQDCAPTLPRPPHPAPTFVTIMIRPSCGPG